MKNMKYMPCILIIISLVSCAKRPDHEGFYYVSGSSDSATELFVNGNPTDRGNAISLFITQGENAIEHRGEFKAEGYSLSLIKTKALFSSEYKQVLSVSLNREEAERNRVQKFTEPVWWKWSWQDADELGEVTKKDYDEIFAITEDLVNLISNKDFTVNSMLGLPYVKWWTDDKELRKRTVDGFRTMSSHMPSTSELVFRRAERADMETLAGKYIVMLRGKGTEVFRLGPREDQAPSNGEPHWTFSYSMSCMFFSKFKGQWKLLIPID